MSGPAKAQGKTSMRGNPSPDMTYLPTLVYATYHMLGFYNWSIANQRH